MRESVVEVRYVDVPNFLKVNPKFNVYVANPETEKFIKIAFENVKDEKRLCYLFERDDDITFIESKNMDKTIIVK